MSDIIFADGLRLEEKTFDNGGKIIKLSIRTEDFITFLQGNENEKGWVNLDIKKSKTGKLYCQLNAYKG